MAKDTIFLFDCKVVDPIIIRARSSELAIKKAFPLIADMLKTKNIEQAEVVGFAINQDKIPSAKPMFLDTPKFISIVSTKTAPIEGN